MNESHLEQPKAAENRGSSLEVLRVILRLGLTAFSDPIAHLGYFREAFPTSEGSVQAVPDPFPVQT